MAIEKDVGKKQIESFMSFADSFLEEGLGIIPKEYHEQLKIDYGKHWENLQENLQDVREELGLDSIYLLPEAKESVDMDKALLVVSFGTSYPETRERTIGAIEQKLSERFPDRAVRRAWTSSFLIRKVAKTEGLAVDTPEEALEKLASDGFKDIIV